MTAPIIALAPDATPEEVAAFTSALRQSAADLLRARRHLPLVRALLAEAAEVERQFGGAR